jgi:hypothetical protein
MTTPPRADSILDIQGEPCRFGHVAKHLYNPCEQWDQLLSEPTEPRRAACAAGCVLADFRGDYPNGERATLSCMAHVLDDHDKLLAPAYRNALAQAESASRVGLQHDETLGWMFVGDGGVVVIVREIKKHKRFEVKTAYRASSKKRAAMSCEDFFKRAVQKLRDKTSWSEEVRDGLK